ncbi:hypothetical protein RND81_01G130900 [Saponaria officinalis]|uniref:S-adenosyl-L-methionine-dependent methyltransferase n=1 Tax=Saponaria officinalis TaxID=3572 RepID=A0AAW1NEA5_SAPOF
MEGILSFTHISTIKMLPHFHGNWYKKTKTHFKFTAKSSNGDDPLLQSAINAVTLRFHETLRSEPLFHDPYAACLVSPSTSIDVKKSVHPYCLITRFLDDKLLQIVGHTDELKQVVLLTDGADTRAYRLTWPSSMLIFDVSTERIYSKFSLMLKDAGAQMSRNCLLIHVPRESPNIQDALRKKGFNGNRPSIWVLQGLPLMTLASLEDILSTVASLAMKGCVLIGEVPAELIETTHELEISREESVRRIFMRHGFQVQVIDYGQVAKDLGGKQLKELSNSILFVAEHLRFSDDQMETWRREFQRVEDEGDEEGFEDL